MTDAETIAELRTEIVALSELNAALRAALEDEKLRYPKPRDWAQAKSAANLYDLMASQMREAAIKRAAADAWQSGSDSSLVRVAPAEADE